MSSVSPQPVKATSVGEGSATPPSNSTSTWTKVKTTGSQCQYFCIRYVPGINLFYDLLFDETPSPENIKDLLNLVGLVDALMISIVITYLTAVEYDEMIQLDERFMILPEGNKTGYYDAYYTDGSGLRFNSDAAPSTRFGIECANSMAFLFSSLCLTLMAYTDLVNKNFDGETEAKTAELVHAWWKYARIGIFFSVIATVFGVCICMGFTTFCISTKFPDYYVEEHGETTTGLNELYGQSSLVIDLAWGVFFFSLISLGFGTFSRFKLGEKHNEEIERDLNNTVMTRSHKQWSALFELTPEVKEYFTSYKEQYVTLLVVQRVDFADRAVITDDQLSKLQIDLIGHRIKMLEMFSDPSLGEKVDKLIESFESQSQTEVVKATVLSDDAGRSDPKPPQGNNDVDDNGVEMIS
mmetsp:Transcript_10211/g.16871  ORF Transcript_10211/g.16871 Transcript_10211/m.16871 type:complete len:410 (-) Transcript_10211:134-1363(-)